MGMVVSVAKPGVSHHAPADGSDRVDPGVPDRLQLRRCWTVVERFPEIA
jgi:hypothetical protein